MDENIDAAVGARIRALRKASKLSMEALGSQVQLTYQQIQKYEKGENRLTISTGARIARALRCNFIDLLPPELQ